jgi:lactate 2-monooxygenase
MQLNALDWQKKIYMEGLSGKRPVLPTGFDALERAAETTMSPRAFAYVAGGAGNEETVQSNISAFAKCKIIPRMLRDVSVCDTSIGLFGKKYPSPFLLSPVGVLELAHVEADLAVAKAASALGVPYIFSNQASYAMEDCARLMGTSPRWFQLYWSKSRPLVTSLVQRAESAGCSAVVVTLDTTMLGWRTRDLDLAYLPFLEGKGIAQYTSDPVFTAMLKEDAEPLEKRKMNFAVLRGVISMVDRYPGRGFLAKLKSGLPMKAVRKFIQIYSNPAITWEDLSFLRQQTKLPILLKGILRAEDAAKAIDFGMDGIVISNHGGRQVDGAISTFEALPAIAEKINNRIPIILDSGIRGGADAFKAIACGANAVCIGRPYVYALALAGQAGVYELLRNYMADFELTMRLAGCRNVQEINPELIRSI